MENSQLKNKIMRKVYMTWFFNKSKPILFLQLPLIVLFLIAEHEYVAFKAVASNALISLNSPSSMFDYAVTAFKDTAPLEAFLAAAIGIFSFLAITSVVRNISAISNKKSAVLPIEIDK
jgi:hypothetical protein